VCYDGQGSITPISSTCFERRRSCSSARFITGAKCFRSGVIRACENGLANFCCKKEKGRSLVGSYHFLLCPGGACPDGFWFSVSVICV
jgi:hypothetical protein